VIPVLKGALVEYASDFLGPLPNVVVFQFNPETVNRTVQIPSRPTGASAREISQAGDLPVEKYDLTIQLNADDPVMPAFTKTVGIGPPLAALQKMVQPAGPIFGPSQVVDAVAAAVSSGSDNPVQLIPRETYPRILFLWGATRILPVVIESMQIVEKQYDGLLNPILADVTMSMSVMLPDPFVDDAIAQGASKYSEGAKEVLAAANLATAAAQVASLFPNLIPF
jgi:hypothetical protein